jgi:hypothetical protein
VAATPDDLSRLENKISQLCKTVGDLKTQKDTAQRYTPSVSNARDSFTARNNERDNTRERRNDSSSNHQATTPSVRSGPSKDKPSSICKGHDHWFRDCPKRKNLRRENRIRRMGWIVMEPDLVLQSTPRAQVNRLQATLRVCLYLLIQCLVLLRIYE